MEFIDPHLIIALLGVMGWGMFFLLKGDDK